MRAATLTRVRARISSRFVVRNSCSILCLPISGESARFRARGSPCREEYPSWQRSASIRDCRYARSIPRRVHSSASKRQEVLHEIPLLTGGQPERQELVVMVDDLVEGGEAPVVVEASSKVRPETL